MKSASVLIAALAAGNLLFAAAWYLKPGPVDEPDPLERTAPQSVEAGPVASDVEKDAVNPANVGGESVSMPTDGDAEMRDWEAGDDEDLQAYAARLRGTGLPEGAVRHLVSGAIDRRFRERERALASGTRSRPRFWEVGQGSESLETKLARLDLRREKAQLLSSVMGADTGTSGELFDSPIPSEKSELVRMITQDYEAMINDIRGRAGALLLESEKQTIAYIEAERRRDLAEILTPQELADYEMINSNTFRSLRHQLRGFETTEEEFRTIYQTQRAFDEQFRPDPGVYRMSSSEERRAEEAARLAADSQLRALLGDERFESYERARNREYQQLSELVQRVDLPESTAIEVFGIRDYVSAESNRIAFDTTLSVEQKMAALAELAQGARAQVRAQLPGEAGDAYLRVADGWLKRVEEGAAVTFRPNGTSVRWLRPRSAPPPPPPGG